MIGRVSLPEAARGVSGGAWQALTVRARWIHITESLLADWETPTPRGEIGASFDVSTGICKMTAPSGTVGRIGIPKVEKTITAISINGTVAWDGTYHAVTGIGSASQDPEFIYLTAVQPGTYTMAVSYSGKTPVYDEPPETYAAQFIRLDSTTSGNWGGVYGRDPTFRINRGPVL